MMNEQQIQRLEQLREKYPETDPLDALFEWDTETKTKVMQALKSYVRIDKYFGDIQWLDAPQDDKADDVELLARATVWEVSRIGREYRLNQAQAAEVADTILNVTNVT